MKKLTLLLSLIFVFACFSGCSSSNVVTITFVQEGNYQPVIRVVEKGKKLSVLDFPELVQDDENFIYYWEYFENKNLTEDFVVNSKKYTKGLVFELGGEGYHLSKYEGSYAYVIVPDHYNGLPVIGINASAFDEDSLTEYKNGVWVDKYSEKYNLTGNRTRFVEWPSTIQKVGASTFYENRLLQEFVVPDGIEELPWGVFFRCHSLKKVTLPQGLKKMGGSVLTETQITSLVIPDGTVELDALAISYNPLLEYVVMPKSINKMGAHAICYYTSGRVKTKIYYKGTHDDWMFIEIDRTPFSGTTDVMSSEEYVYFYSEIEPTESGNYWHYVDGEPTIWA